jgi:hypothetical protein
MIRQGCREMGMQIVEDLLSSDQIHIFIWCLVGPDSRSAWINSRGNVKIPVVSNPVAVTPEAGTTPSPVPDGVHHHRRNSPA